MAVVLQTRVEEGSKSARRTRVFLYILSAMKCKQVPTGLQAYFLIGINEEGMF